MSNYSNDLTWEQWMGALSSNLSGVVGQIRSGKDWYDKWYSFTYGMSDEQIQALPAFSTHTIADITAMRYAWGVFNDLYNALNNLGALTQANRIAYLVPFKG